MEPRFDAYCGLYCGSCTAFMATKENTVKELAARWRKEEDDVRCRGCKSDTVASFCRTCGLKACARQKGLEFCFQCEDYPCDRLDEFRNNAQYPYHIEVYDYLQTIKQYGVGYWLEAMKSRWSCAACGREHDWFTPVCPACGGRLNTYKKPT
jgi:hypothetical protein